MANVQLTATTPGVGPRLVLGLATSAHAPALFTFMFMFTLGEVVRARPEATPQGLAAIKIGFHAGDDSSSSGTNTARVTAVAPRPERHPGVSPGSQEAVGGLKGFGRREAKRHDARASPVLSNSRPGRPSGLGDGDNGNGNDSARGNKDKQRQRASKRGP